MRNFRHCGAHGQRIDRPPCSAIATLRARIARVDFAQMRFHYHDFRDMPQAIVLACDLRRVVQASIGLLWTIAIAAGLAFGLSLESGDRPQLVILALLKLPATLPATLLWAGALALWWLGFGFINASVLRSCALEIARDIRGRQPSEPAIARMAALAPLLGIGIALAFSLGTLIFSLLAHIPGVVGAIVVAITLPLGLACALLAALGLILVAASAPMMPATAAVEGRDVLEAVSRPAGFVLQKPFRYMGYLLAKFAVLLFATILGAGALALAWAIIAGCMSLVGAGEIATMACRVAILTDLPAEPMEHLPAFAVASVFWASVATLAAWLCVVAQAADLITYLLMRYRIEGATYEQIMIPQERLAMLPTAIETAQQAEEARQRFDQQEAAKSATAPTEG